MATRRVVTGHDDEGRSVIVADGPIPRTHVMQTLPGASSALAWATEAGGQISPGGADPTDEVTSYVPGPGGTRFIVLTVPPHRAHESPDFDPAKVAAERLASSPGLAETFEPDGYGMHTTPTIDCAIVLSGQLVLELDGGRTTLLAAGDLVIQNGTRHAWRNPSDEIATIAFLLIGADR